MLTPCILPVLPALVVVSGGRGGARVAGVVSGIVLGFCATLLLLAAMGGAVARSSDVLRGISAAVLLGFGLALIVPALRRGTRPAVHARAAALPLAGRAGRTGLALGVLAGTALGFVWMPATGPILESIGSAVSREGIGAAAVVATIGYGLGMALPLTAVAIGGRQVLRRIESTAASARRLHLAMGATLLVTSAAVFGGLDAQVGRTIAATFPFTSTPVAALERAAPALHDAPARSCAQAERVADDRRAIQAHGYPQAGRLCDLGPAPTFASDLGPWLNTTDGAPVSAAELRGKVVLVDLWTYSCITCIRSLPYLRGWHDRYAREGLVIVGVHTPEFAFERSLANVRKATRDLDVRWPVALDNSYRTWNRFANRSRPTRYLIDRSGRLRAVQSGEGSAAHTERQIRALLGVEPGSARADARGAVSDLAARTPETYLGAERAARFAGRATGGQRSAAGFAVGRPASYRASRGELGVDTWSLSGRWTVLRERAVAGRGARLMLRYRARDVYLVMSPPRGRPATVGVRVDGRARGGVRVTANQLYTVAADRASGTRQLELAVPPGVAVYAFSFG